MADIIDQEQLDVNEGTEELDTEALIAALETSQPEETAETQEPEEDDLPEKYRGKSVKELAEMHQNAEKALGTQGAEVGELRKVVDSYITANLKSNDTTVTEAPEEVDFFEDPSKAVSTAIDQHPSVQQATKAAQDFQRQTALSKLQQKHPDMDSVLSTSQFIEWVKGSPVRIELFQRADQGYDFNAADELISTWKERTSVAQQTLETEKASRKQQVQAASTGSASGSTEGGTKKVYRRADIIKLMQTDPDRYDVLQPEIMQAYAEGRVR